ncbi:MAG: hypothetical protein GDA65_01095 [Nitrospira sp. CR1.1]|jgi:hypothetical protein|nr:hypothetical protein [Nitrospira sp. CR1.1]
MRIIEGMKWMAASFVLLTIVTIMPGVVRVAGAGEHDWLDAMMQAVLVEQAKEEGEGDRFTPYVVQLSTVRTHLRNGEGEAVYQTMNRFMEMLQAREAGISQEAADRLFDYCYVVTPARYHDVSRHLHRLS